MIATSLPRLQLTLDHITECYFPQLKYDNCTLLIARTLYASARLGPQYHIRSVWSREELIIDSAAVPAPVIDSSTNLTGRSCQAPDCFIPLLNSLTVMWSLLSLWPASGPAQASTCCWAPSCEWCRLQIQQMLPAQAHASSLSPLVASIIDQYAIAS